MHYILSDVEVQQYLMDFYHCLTGHLTPATLSPDLTTGAGNMLMGTSLSTKTIPAHSSVYILLLEKTGEVI